MTFAVLAPYRNKGVGSKLLDNLLKSVAKHEPKIDEVILHVQINNEQAIRLYSKFGFKMKEKITNYYRRVEPRDAYLLYLEIK